VISLTLANLVLIIIPLILLEGFFSGSEIALLSADKLTLKRQSQHGDSGSNLALNLAKHPERILSATLLMTSFCVITISSFIEVYCIQSKASYPSLTAILFTSPIIVLFGELIPKVIYQRNANLLAPWIAYPVYWVYWLCFPITRIIASYTNRLSRIVAPIEELVGGKKITTREEIRALLSYTKRETEITSTEKQMIKRIFDFRYSDAKHAMIPLVRIDAIDESSTVHEALTQFEKHRHSRMPVYADRVDNIIGILEISDLLTATDLNQPIKPYITAAYFAAETQALQDLLLDMRKEQTEMAVVVDEYGGAVGILTVEDIVEEVVGEISDEYDYDAQPYKELPDHTWIVQARMEIQQINEILRLDLPEGNYETLSGFLLQQFGRIPERKDELFFNTSRGLLKFTVQQATEKHIETVLIEEIEQLKESD